MKREKYLTIANILALLATIAVNGLANLLPINGQQTGQISDSFPIYFVPAGYVFTIWGLIYLGLLGFAIYQALPAQSTNPRIRAISPYFLIGNLANIAWIFFWHYELFYLTLPTMVVILATLIMTYIKLRRGKPQVSIPEKLFVRLPFSIYLGWITVATVANTSQVLFYSNWDGWGLLPEIWAVIMLIVATTLATLMIFREMDIAYGLVMIWAFVGIALKHADVAPVMLTAWIFSAIIGAGILLIVFTRPPAAMNRN